jgi:hypothetical protein
MPSAFPFRPIISKSEIRNPKSEHAFPLPTSAFFFLLYAPFPTSDFPPGRRPLWPLRAGGRIPTSDFPIPPSAFHFPFSTFRIPPSAFTRLCPMLFALCSLPHAPCSLPHAPCSLPHAPCSLPYALCSPLSALSFHLPHSEFY